MARIEPKAPPAFRVLDVFAGGCGGWSLGLHWAGPFETVALCEIDEFRRQMLAQNFPKAKLYADIRDLTASRLRADGVGRIDVLAGSPPCQDASQANPRGKGIEGERTGLVFEWLRLLRETRPRWACFENVPGLVRRGLDRVLSDVEDQGYTVQTFNISARNFGAPHIRERLWCVAWDPGQVGRETQLEKPTQQGLVAQPSPRSGCNYRRAQHRGAADAQEEQAWTAGLSWQRISADGSNSSSPWRGDWIDRIGEHVRSYDGLSPGMARKCAEAFGDAVIPQIPQAIGRAIIAAERDAAQRIAADCSAKAEGA